MNSVTDPAKRDRWARLRLSIIGPLLAAPPADGELQAALVALAAKSWRHPLADKEICFGVSTLERWYYAAKSARDPVAAPRNRLRDDVGRFPSLAPRVIEVLVAQYREHPGWTMQLHVDNLRVALRLLAQRLSRLPDITVGVITHPQSSLADFYRDLGDIFAVPLTQTA